MLPFIALSCIPGGIIFIFFIRKTTKNWLLKAIFSFAIGALIVAIFAVVLFIAIAGDKSKPFPA